VAERLQKIMAQAGVGSRRESETIIAAGRVTVNGVVAGLGDKADPVVDRIEVDGRPLTPPDDAYIYIALHKPRGVLSSLDDELAEGRTTVRDLVPVHPEAHIYPVGRLDKPSEGLILMTNDGQLAHRLTHPRFEHEKVYDVTVEGYLTDSALDQWRRGVVLDGRITTPAPIELLGRDEHHTRFRLILREGKKRQIRRIAASFDHPVTRLVRERIGPIGLGDLKAGEWRYLSAAEVAQLRRAAAHLPMGARRAAGDRQPVRKTRPAGDGP
jgi:pseudouridine synthase